MSEFLSLSAALGTPRQTISLPGESWPHIDDRAPAGFQPDRASDGLSANGAAAAGTSTAALVSRDPLSAIDWGTKVPTTVIDVYFAPTGTYIDDYTGLGPAQGFSAFEKRQVFSALEQIENVTNLRFRETTSQTSAEFRLGTFDLPEDSVSFMEPPGGQHAGFMAFDPYYLRLYDADSGNRLLSRGGYLYAFLLHEFGHGLGLAHPHDEGGSSTILRGVNAPWHSYGVGDLNQGVYTMMSWNHGWPAGPYGYEYYDGTYLHVNDFGYEATPMALDVAALQRKYGANLSHAKGNNVYFLPETNGLGTFFESIWDAGGNDAIRYDGNADAIINLRAATLAGEAGGGGFVSYAAGIRGGYTIAARTVIERAIGGAGDDALTGNGADNLLKGRLGNDTINGRGGNDTLRGGGEFDTLRGGDGDDLVFGGDGRDTAYLGAGNDLFRDNAQGGALGRDTVFAGVGADTVQGGNGGDEFRGAGGNDLILGRKGDDALFGGTEFDTLNGGMGNDTLDGGLGRDTAYLGAGNDLYRDNGQGGDLGRDTVFGGAGDDTVQGGNGDDQFRGAGGNDLILGRKGDDALFGGTEFDTLNGGMGNDTLDGGLGRDTAYLGAGNDLYRDNGQGGDLGRDTVFGGAGDDTVQGGNGGDEFRGAGGNDLILGRKGDDLLAGGPRFDTLDGGSGNDTLTGGGGADTFVFADGGGADRVTDFTPGTDILQLDTGLWSGNLSGAQVVTQFASVSGGNVVLDFGGGDAVTLEGVTSSVGLENELLFVTAIT